MEFITIFTQMSWLAILFFSIGVVCLFVELFVPGFGFFGILGIICLIAGIVVRVCQGLNFVQIVSLILVVLGVLTAFVVFMVYSAQHGVLSKTGLFEHKSTLNSNYNQTDSKIIDLIGKSGVAKTKIDLSGKACIENVIYDVVSKNEYISAGENVCVVAIEDNEIIVEKF